MTCSFLPRHVKRSMRLMLDHSIKRGVEAGFHICSTDDGSLISGKTCFGKNNCLQIKDCGGLKTEGTFHTHPIKPLFVKFTNEVKKHKNIGEKYQIDLYNPSFNDYNLSQKDDFMCIASHPKAAGQKGNLACFKTKGIPFKDASKGSQSWDIKIPEEMDVDGDRKIHIEAYTKDFMERIKICHDNI